MSVLLFKKELKFHTRLNVVKNPPIRAVSEGQKSLSEKSVQRISGKRVLLLCFALVWLILASFASLRVNLAPDRARFIEGVSVTRFLLVGFGPLLISWGGRLIYTAYQRRWLKPTENPGEPSGSTGESMHAESTEVELKNSPENVLVRGKVQED